MTFIIARGSNVSYVIAMCDKNEVSFEFSNCLKYHFIMRSKKDIAGASLLPKYKKLNKCIPFYPKNKIILTLKVELNGS